VSAAPRRLHPHPQRQALAQVGDLAAVTQKRGWKVFLGLPHPAERPFDPWTFLLDEWLNVPEGEMVWNDYLHAIGVDLDSRM
jgi:hypothetical protein